MTGFSARVRALILTRDGGCALCGRHSSVPQVHHRSPRGMGGSRAAWVNQPGNGVTLCPNCHQWVETNRADAEQLGYIVRRGITPPEQSPIQHHRYGWVLLNNNGTTETP